MTTPDPEAWKREFHRRIMLVLIPDAQTHLDHGFDPAELQVSTHEANRRYWSETAQTPQEFDTFVGGDCPCGEHFRGSLEMQTYDDGEVEAMQRFAAFMKALTAETAE